MNVLQVGVKVLLKNPEGKFLVLARSAKYETAEGSWDIPGGRIDPDTGLIENLVREVREETGLSLTDTPKFAGAQDIFFRNGKGEDIHIVRLTYLARVAGEPVLDGAEHTAFQWVSYAELMTIENLDPYLKALLDEGTINEQAW